MKTLSGHPASSYAVAALVLCSLPIQAQAPPAQQVKAGMVELQRVQEKRTVTGSLRALSRAEIAAIEPGRVVSIDVDEADRVKKGDLLAKIDTRRLSQQVAQNESELEISEATISQREAELQNYRADLEALQQAQMQMAGAVSDQDIRAARTNVRVAEARLNVARKDLQRVRARLGELHVRLEDCVIRAPFDGRVVRRQAELGEWLNPGDPVVTLVSSGVIEAWIEVPEKFDYALLEGSQEFDIDIEPLGLRMKPRSVRVVPDVDPRSRRFIIIARLLPRGQPLAPGMSVTASIPTGELAQRLTVPADAVLRDRGGFFVYKAQPTTAGGRLARPVSVQVLYAMQDRLAVDSPDLAKGDLVVVEGNERLRPMSPIEIVVESADGGSR